MTATLAFNGLNILITRLIWMRKPYLILVPLSETTHHKWLKKSYSEKVLFEWTTKFWVKNMLWSVLLRFGTFFFELFYYPLHLVLLPKETQSKWIVRFHGLISLKIVIRLLSILIIINSRFWATAGVVFSFLSVNKTSFFVIEKGKTFLTFS